MTTLTANSSSNYSQDIIDSMVAQYTANPTRETVDAISAEIGKPVRSVISKLSAIGVYQKAEKAAKKAEPIIKKEVYIAQIQEALGIELASFDKMTKSDLQNLADRLQK